MSINPIYSRYEFIANGRKYDLVNEKRVVNSFYLMYTSYVYLTDDTSKREGEYVVYFKQRNYK